MLELIYDSNESEHHTVVIVGDISGFKLPGSKVRILHWDDIEREGASIAKTALPVPGELSLSPSCKHSSV